MIELVDTKPIEIKGLFVIEKEKTKQRLIFDARANLYFAEHENPQMPPHPGIFMQLQLGKNEEVHVGKLDLASYYHRLELLKQFKTYFGLPTVKLNGKWSGLATGLSQWDGSIQ